MPDYSYTMVYPYHTLQGDTWDMIALDWYGDEHLAHVIMQANPSRIKTLVFGAGELLRIPVIKIPAAATLPPWKRG